MNIQLKILGQTESNYYYGDDLYTQSDYSGEVQQSTSGGDLTNSGDVALIGLTIGAAVIFTVYLLKILRKKI